MTTAESTGTIVIKDHKAKPYVSSDTPKPLTTAATTAAISEGDASQPSATSRPLSTNDHQRLPYVTGEAIAITSAVMKPTHDPKDDIPDHGDKHYLPKEALDRQSSNVQVPPRPTERDFPAPFYCPITKDLIQNPVVAPDGISYEKDAFVTQMKGPRRVDLNIPLLSDPSKLYPNRALIEIMEETFETSGNSFRAGLMRFQRTMQSNIQQLMDRSALPTSEYRPLPDSYYCPITFELMHVPTIDPEGNTFEKAAVLHWIRANKNSPITRSPLQVSQLYPNLAIQDLLDEMKKMSDDSIHPAIKTWKETEPPHFVEENDGQDEESPAVSQGADATVLNPYNFPSSPAEMDSRRRERASSNCTVIAMLFLVAAIVVLFLYAPMIGFVCLGLYVFNKRFTGRSSRTRRRRT